MSAYSFRRAAGELAVEAWRPLDRALYRWVVDHGGGDLLAATAAWTSFADGQGDAALPLTESRHGMAPLTAEQITALRESPFVATQAAQGVRPFVLDAGDRFYLHRNHADEAAAAARIRERRAASEPVIDDAQIDADLDALFHGDRSDAVAAQRAAVRAVAGQRLFVLTGGPARARRRPCCACCSCCSDARNRRSRSASPRRRARPRSGSCRRCVKASRDCAAMWAQRCRTIGCRCSTPSPTTRR
jgi:exodeoxyribonuclease V alpha subunit